MQTVLMHVVASNRVQMSLAAEMLNCWTAYKKHTSVSYVQLTGCRIHLWEYENTVTEHEVQIHNILPAFYSYHTSVTHVSFKLRLREIKSHVLIAQTTNLAFFCTTDKAVRPSKRMYASLMLPLSIFSVGLTWEGTLLCKLVLEKVLLREWIKGKYLQ